MMSQCSAVLAWGRGNVIKMKSTPLNLLVHSFLVCVVQESASASLLVSGIFTMVSFL